MTFAIGCVRTWFRSSALVFDQPEPVVEPRMSTAEFEIDANWQARREGFGESEVELSTTFGARSEQAYRLLPLSPCCLIVKAFLVFDLNNHEITGGDARRFNQSESRFVAKRIGG